jgi:hypothetical protein
MVGMVSSTCIPSCIAVVMKLLAPLWACGSIGLFWHHGLLAFQQPAIFSK